MQQDLILKELRSKWREAKEEEDKQLIEESAKAYKENSKFGSLGVEGNGFCYKCYVQKAREGRYTCQKCAGVIDKNRKTKDLKIPQIQTKLKEMGQKAKKENSNKLTITEIKEIFL